MNEEEFRERFETDYTFCPTLAQIDFDGSIWPLTGYKAIPEADIAHLFGTAKEFELWTPDDTCTFPAPNPDIVKWWREHIAERLLKYEQNQENF